MILLNTSTLCICDSSILNMLCFYGDLMRIIIFIKNMLQFILVALPLEHEAFHFYLLIKNCVKEMKM
jgi:hypothetical protein